MTYFFNKQTITAKPDNCNPTLRWRSSSNSDRTPPPALCFSPRAPSECAPFPQCCHWISKLALNRIQLPQNCHSDPPINSLPTICCIKSCEFTCSCGDPMILPLHTNRTWIFYRLFVWIYMNSHCCYVHRMSANTN